MPFRRETMIALRARRKAHRIAKSIANPYLDIPRPPSAVGDPRDDEIELAERPVTDEDRAAIPPVIPALVMVIVGGIVICVILGAIVIEALF